MPTDPFQSAEWRRFATRMRAQLAPMIAGSKVTVSIAPPNDEIDIQYGLELGLSIIMNKPILTVVPPGRSVPDKLARVSDVVVSADLGTPEGQQAVQAALKKLGLPSRTPEP